MKIVHLSLGVIPVPPGDVAAGIEGYIYQLTRSLGKLGCVIHVIDIKGGEQQREKRSESSAVFHEVWHPPLPARSNYIFLQHFTLRECKNTLPECTFMAKNTFSFFNFWDIILSIQLYGRIRCQGPLI